MDLRTVLTKLLLQLYYLLLNLLGDTMATGRSLFLIIIMTEQVNRAVVSVLIGGKARSILFHCLRLILLLLHLLLQL